MGMMKRPHPISLVFMVSGSGKTYFVTQQAEKLIKRLNPSLNLMNSKVHPVIIDGDELISDTVGFPPGEWWITMKEDDLTIKIEEMLDIIVEAALQSFVVWGVFPLTTEMLDKALLKHGLPRESVAFLETDEQVLRRNIDFRKVDIDQKGHPVDIESILSAQTNNLAIHGKDDNSKHLSQLFGNFLESSKAYVRIWRTQDSLVGDRVLGHNDTTFTVRRHVKGGTDKIEIFGGDAVIPVLPDESRIYPWDPYRWAKAVKELRRWFFATF
jgi:hypothetical protein